MNLLSINIILHTTDNYFPYYFSWGIAHEKDARANYQTCSSQHHVNEFPLLFPSGPPAEGKYPRQCLHTVCRESHFPQLAGPIAE